MSVPLTQALGPKTEMISVLFIILFVMAIVWLFLAYSLLAAIRNRHPVMHAELGSPKAFETQATPALFKFLYTRRPERLGDTRLLGLAWFMRVYFSMYLIGLLALVYLSPK